MAGEPATRPGRPRSEAARRAILGASLALLKRHGVAGVTAEAIAERAGVSKATLYRWWPCATATAMDAFLEEVVSRLPSPATNRPIEDLRACARQAARLLGGPLGDVLAELIAAAHTDRRLAEIFHERYLAPSRRNLRRVVDRAVAAGALRDDVDAEIVIDVICGAYYYRKLVRHEDTSPRTMDAIMSCVLEGLVPRTSGGLRLARAAPTARRGSAAAVAPASPARRRTRGGSASLR
jgi:AcrR family transcriptional regulator